MSRFRVSTRFVGQFLPNGLLQVWDYECQWGMLYHKGEGGKWESHCGKGNLPAYAHLLEKINAKR